MPRAKKAAPVAPESDSEAPALAASAFELVPLARLRRAPENVRHTNQAVDIESLADDIAAHGLLQNLIGYAGDTSIDKAVVYIVGGGRRLQALQRLLDLGAVAEDFPVPVLLRSPAEAIDLSLSENLAKRDMNPADEFLAFEALMKPGLLSPADLAKKFGFSERYVKQRLRLAALAPEILDALREGKLTIDAAMAYAESQDQKLQLRIFTAEGKKPYDCHKPSNIRYAYQSQQMTTSDPLFKLVGAKRYEEQGGEYEDDLFADAERWGARKIKDGAVVLRVARSIADYQKPRLLAQAQRKFPSTSDVLFPPAIRRGALPKAPKGFKVVDRGYRYNLPSHEELRQTAATLGMDIVAIASVGLDGEFSIEDRFFVPGDRLDEVLPPQGQRPPEQTPEEMEALRRASAIRSVAAFLAAKKIRDEKIDGRQFWRTTRPDLWRSSEVDGIGACYAVAVDVLVTPEDIDAQLEAAEIQYDREEAEKEAARTAREAARLEAVEAKQKRMNEVLAMDPAPAVVVVDGDPYFIWGDGVSYGSARDNSSEADDCDLYDTLIELLETGEAIGATFASFDAYDAAQLEQAA